MPKLVFDIETVGVDFDSLDEKSQEYLLNFAETLEDKSAVREGLGFSPLTGEIVAIGIYNPDTEKGAVYYRTDEKEKTSEEFMQYIPCATEKELLMEFWGTTQFYDQFVTFAGHIFDCPYLMIRSAILKIKPAKNLMHNRYSFGPHFDLLDRLTNFGAIRGKRSLHMWCQAFGIESPKDKGITGADVARLYKEKKYLEIAKYCGDDLKATAELYHYWDKYINIK